MSDKQISSEQEKFREELRIVFSDRSFSATDVVLHAGAAPGLGAAIDAAVPRSRYMFGHRKGRLNSNAVGIALRRLDGKGLIAVTRHYYWSFRVPPV